jgi:arylformamidase
LFKTRNTDFLGSRQFRTDYVGLASDAARFLVDRGCRLVGIDYYSICPYRDLKTTHEILLGGGVAIIEGLVLREVAAGPVEIIALPLKITGGDASPTRVLIRPRASAQKK